MNFSGFSPQAMAVFWLAVGIAAAVAEGLSVQLTSIWFALGAAVASISAMLGADFSIQCVLFFVMSGLLLVVSRPLVKKKLHVDKVSTNADQVIGQAGVVLQAIDNVHAAGRVQVMGLDWSARSSDGQPIPKDAKVRVLSIDGVKVIVEPIAVPKPAQAD